MNKYIRVEENSFVYNLFYLYFVYTILKYQLLATKSSQLKPLIKGLMVQIIWLLVALVAS